MIPNSRSSNINPKDSFVQNHIKLIVYPARSLSICKFKVYNSCVPRLACMHGISNSGPTIDYTAALIQFTNSFSIC